MHGIACMQDALLQLRQLRSLYIGIHHLEESASHTMPSQLLSDLAAGLPALATLQWNESCGPEECVWPGAFSDDFITTLAEESSRQGPVQGLRLLQANDSGFEPMRSLPPSLQYLALSNEILPIRGNVLLLLERCSSLRELYLLNQEEGAHDMPNLVQVAAACPRLRVLVFHIWSSKLQVSTSMLLPIAPCTPIKS